MSPHDAVRLTPSQVLSFATVLPAPYRTGTDVLIPFGKLRLTRSKQLFVEYARLGRQFSSGLEKSDAPHVVTTDDELLELGQFQAMEQVEVCDQAGARREPPPETGDAQRRRRRDTAVGPDKPDSESSLRHYSPKI